MPDPLVPSSAKPVLLSKGQRRYFLIKKSLQLKVIGWVMFAVFLALLLIGFDIYTTFGREVVQEVMDPDLAGVFKGLGWVLLFKLSVYMVAVAFLALYLSNKFAGPVYRVQRSTQAVAEGDLTHRVRLRQGDELMDLQDDFNAMMASIQQKVSQDAALGGRIARQLEELSKQPGLPEESLRRLRELAAEASHIGASFKI